MTEIYLDNAASTPMPAAVADAVHEAAREHFANPGSVHRAGQRARRALESAREEVAAALGAPPFSLVFTSGATEAINQALHGLSAGRKRLITSPLEHMAVLSTARRLAADGTEVRLVQPEDGVVTADAVLAASPGAGDVVALMSVNNETGVRTDIPRIARRVAKRGAVTFADATQSFGTESVDVGELAVDALCISGHKCGGPRGVGVLYVRPGIEMPPLIAGGEQERGLRAGTSNLPAIVGMGVAARLVREQGESVRRHIQALRDSFEAAASRLEGVSVNAAGALRGVKHTSLSVAGVDGESLMMRLDAAGLQVSTGSACTAGSIEPSHVLIAMGMEPDLARATLRVSFGAQNTPAEVTEAVKRLAVVISQLREASKGTPA